ncbi:multi antimicrobial extrusion protein [Tanacetum coccineum]|uniref:Multi antimicrobial extrusion protein n=1 Tax=Tanacetum coccineum TaxID=301880 RepID=A0ABQ5AIX9_9ASTR
MENGKQHLQPLLTVESGVKINGVRGFCKEFYMESKKLWYLAGPAIFTSLCQYTIGATTQLFAGQLGTIQLAAVSVENSVIAGFSYSILFSYKSWKTEMTSRLVFLRNAMTS